MPKLTEYLGSIISSITSARVMADIQTVKVAEQYAQHELLKHFSVPRMRLDDVELTIPVALDQLTEKTETVYEPIDNTRFSSLVYRAVTNAMGMKSLPQKPSTELRSQLAQYTQQLEQELRIGIEPTPVSAFSERVGKLALMLAREYQVVSPDRLEKLDVAKLAQAVATVASQEIKVSRQQQVLDQLNVIAESHRLKEQRPEDLIYIKLKISEDGMEWQSMEQPSGEISRRLLPE